MKSAVLCCLVVLSLGLSAAPVPVAADVSMGSMLSIFSRGLLSVDAAKKPAPRKTPPKKKTTKHKPTKKKPTKHKPTKHKPTKHKPTKKKPTKKKPTPKKTTPKAKPTVKPKPTAPKPKPTAPKPTAKPVSTPASPSGKNTIPKGAPGTVQPDVSDPTPNAPKAGSGKCVSGAFTIFNSPLVPFSSAKATCTSKGMVLASISTIFEPDSNALMQAAQTAIEACEGTNEQVWFDTTLTTTDSPPTCNAFMVTNQPTAGTTGAAGRRLAGATPLVLLASSVPTGCATKLPVMCVSASATS
jgi:hypothetical protein